MILKYNNQVLRYNKVVQEYMCTGLTAEAGPDQIGQGPQYNGLIYINLQATTPTEGIGTWTSDNAFGQAIQFDNIHSPTAICSLDTSSVAAGNYPHVLTWTVTKNVYCSVSDTMTATFDVTF